MKIAIIGTGIAGNCAAWLLNQSHDITVFEQNDYIGGHSNTAFPPGAPAVDTGFIVYNEWTYPNLIALFDHLGVARQQTDMSFAVSIDEGQLEYSGDAVFGQKSNLIRPRFYRMLVDIVRFYKQAPAFLDKTPDSAMTLNEYLRAHNYSKAFIHHHILPMAAAIWSTDTAQVGEFPAVSFIRFFVNHGLFLFKERPQWWTVTGGSHEYVKKLTADFSR